MKPHTRKDKRCAGVIGTMEDQTSRAGRLPEEVTFDLGVFCFLS